MIDVLSGLLNDMSQGFVGFFQRSPMEVLHDCLDIGLVAVLIYWALVILRGTRAMQVAIGLCLVFVGYLLSRRIGLVTVTWTILDSVLAYLAVIVVIIFQSDIRRALARMGRRPLLRGQRTAQKKRQTIEEVIKAAGTLAQKRIGALIAFERSAALDEFIERGTEVDAAVSRSFSTASSYRVSKTRCTTVPWWFVRDASGKRACSFPWRVPQVARPVASARVIAPRLGISEQSDAVVVVVSGRAGRDVALLRREYRSQPRCGLVPARRALRAVLRGRRRPVVGAPTRAARPTREAAREARTRRRVPNQDKVITAAVAREENIR